MRLREDDNIRAAILSGGPLAAAAVVMYGETSYSEWSALDFARSIATVQGYYQLGPSNLAEERRFSQAVQTFALPFLRAFLRREPSLAEIVRALEAIAQIGVDTDTYEILVEAIAARAAAEPNEFEAYGRALSLLAKSPYAPNFDVHSATVMINHLTAGLARILHMVPDAARAPYLAKFASDLNAIQSDIGRRSMALALENVALTQPETWAIRSVWKMYPFADLPQPPSASECRAF